LFIFFCQFDVLLNSDESHWCTLFNETDFLEAEYIDDLTTYYESGYGSSINGQVVSPLFIDMVLGMDAIVQNSSNTFISKLRFAHSSSIAPLTTLLGLFKDNYTLTANTFYGDRQYYTSRFDCMASNIALVLYQCTGSSPQPTYVVKLQHNEQELPIPGCSGGIYCNYTEFKSIYNTFLQTNFFSFCDLSSSEYEENSDDSLIALTQPQFIGVILGVFFGGIVLVVLFAIPFLRKPRYEKVV